MLGRRTAGVWPLLLAAAVATRAAGAQAPTLRLRVDNDLLALRGAGAPPDYDYTHGTELSLRWPSSPRWLARRIGRAADCGALGARDAGCLESDLALGQSIYTPRHNVPTAEPGDRPHAAWLYAAATLDRLAGRRLQSLALSAGVTGRPALGEPVQNGVHRLLHNHREAGWGDQLPAHVGVATDYDGAVAVAEPRAPATATAGALVATWGATFGTLRRALRAGASARYGFGSARPWDPDVPLERWPRAFYLSAGYQQEFVARDAFIEGAGGGAPGAVLRPWVGEARASLGWRGRRVTVAYQYVARGREYRAEPSAHAYGSVTLSLRRPST